MILIIKISLKKTYLVLGQNNLEPNKNTEIIISEFIDNNLPYRNNKIC